MILTNQNREDLKRNMVEDEYRNLIVITFPELNTNKFNIDIPALAKMVAIHIFVNEKFFDYFHSFEVAQIEIITRKILKNIMKDGTHGLLYR